MCHELWDTGREDLGQRFHEKICDRLRHPHSKPYSGDLVWHTVGHIMQNNQINRASSTLLPGLILRHSSRSLSLCILYHCISLRYILSVHAKFWPLNEITQSPRIQNKSTTGRPAKDKTTWTQNSKFLITGTPHHTAANYVRPPKLTIREITRDLMT